MIAASRGGPPDAAHDQPRDQIHIVVPSIEVPIIDPSQRSSVPRSDSKDVLASYSYLGRQRFRMSRAPPHSAARRLHSFVSQLHHTPGISLFVRDAYTSYSPLNSSLINFSSGPTRSAHINNIAT
jgi:hypothetical protein